MTEGPPEQPERHLGTYRVPRDEALHIMALNEWGNESGGNTSSPTGAFYRVSNSLTELREVLDVFQEEFSGIDGLEPRTLIGHFIVVEKREGFVDVHQFPDEDSAVAGFRKHERIYQFWQDVMGFPSEGRDEGSR